MATYWNAEITVDDRCVCITGDDTLGKAIARAVTDCVYYQTVYPDSKIAVVGLHEVCARCHNTGFVQQYSKKGGRTVKCPTCKGHKATGTCDTIAFAMPDASNRIKLVQTA